MPHRGSFPFTLIDRPPDPRIPAHLPVSLKQPQRMGDRRAGYLVLVGEVPHVQAMRQAQGSLPRIWLSGSYCSLTRIPYACSETWDLTG